MGGYPKRSRRPVRLRQQFSKAVIHTGHPEIRLALKGLAQVVYTVVTVRQELDDGKDEVLGLIERIKNSRSS